MAYSREDTIVLFDVDGTLTKPRNAATPEMKEMLAELRKRVNVGVVGGSDLNKIREQLGSISEFDYVFSENGLMAHKDGNLFYTESFKNFMGEEKIKAFVNFTLRYLSEIDIPVKRGTFIEFRNGMLNISPIGRNCSQSERDDFERYDKVHGVRAAMVTALQNKFPEFGLKYSIGGQISFDVFPLGWDKTYCLRHLPEDKYKHVFFFGDKTMVGGNDYEISVHPRIVKSFTVTSPDDTIRFIKETFFH
eukprot:TRINITY_DN1479_c0_g1_i3.p1 TRINITY_DN1479_c0_g1~~TRINITY_DN1479_c0_g1_i3.p1  ORF type:complete len:248 (+),score=48.68 TRINITY_DN1479_c0_g1_i3:113-856(+)